MNNHLQRLMGGFSEAYFFPPRFAVAIVEGDFQMPETAGTQEPT